MSRNNYKRMMQLIEDVFATREDPGQLQVTNVQLEKLRRIHPATLTELANDDGPLIWVLVIPTTAAVMREFLTGTINEKELLELTEPGQAYEAIYLCSVTTLPEARGQGKTMALCLQAIRSILQDHPVKYLYVWPFTGEGQRLAERLAASLGLPLKLREK